MTTPPIYRDLPETAKSVVMALADVTVGSEECGTARQRAVTVIRPVLDDMHMRHPTARDVRVIMVSWGLPNDVANQHAAVIAAMIRTDIDVESLQRQR